MKTLKERRGPRKYPGNLPADGIKATPQIEVLCQRMAILSQRRKAIADEMVGLQETISKYMGSKNQLFDPSGTILNVTYIPYVKEVFDKEQFTKDHPKMLQAYIIKKTVRLFLIK